MLGAIEKRRSCRQFDDREVEDEKIAEICKAGLLAPSAMHNENVEIIVIKDPSTKKRLSSLNARIASMPEGKDPLLWSRLHPPCHQQEEQDSHL